MWHTQCGYTQNCIRVVVPDDEPPVPAKPADPGEPQQQVVVTTMTTEEAAQQVVASLTLPEFTAEVGPDPSINRWKMAAVGYPLWLWAEGPTSLPTRGEAAGGLSVSVGAELTGVTFDMGDGHTVNCSGAGHRWSKENANKDGACGYRYTKASLPEGSYTVTATAHWEVRWSVGGDSGTVAMQQTSAREIPVGELQVLTR